VTLARRLLTPRWIAFTLLVAAAATAFLYMAWWQLLRFESSSGSWQNLGYTLQWPFFAAFAVYVWWKLLREADDPAAEPAHDPGEAAADPVTATDGTTAADPVTASVASTGTDCTDAPRADSADTRQNPLPTQRPARTPAAEVVGASARPDDEDDPELAAYNAYLAALHRRTLKAESRAELRAELRAGETR
jgi:DNA-binding transcriptional regulator of glucitol operon